MFSRISLPVLLPRLADLEPRAVGRDAGVLKYGSISRDAVFAFTDRGAAICEAGRHNFDGRAGNVISYVPVDSPTPECLAEYLRYKIGRQAVVAQWDTWMDSLHAEGRAARTVESLLADTQARKTIQAAMKAGKAYSQETDWWASRRIVRAAIDVLNTRAKRRADRGIAEHARTGTSNLIGIRLTAKRAQQKADADALVAAEVKGAKYSLYRISQSSWAGGHHTTTVNVGARIGASGGSEKVWSRNGKWSGQDSYHALYVHADWIAAVQERGVAVCDGMLTLDAEPVLGHGPELFRAAWAEQGKGFDLNCVHGYIARIGKSTYHAKTARAALDGIQRKLGLKPARRQGVIDLDKLARRHGDLPVYFSDSRDVGNCDSGTRSWCNAVGVDPAGATLAEVVAGYKLRPLPEVVRVIRRVVRTRHERQPLDLSAINGAAKLISDGRVVFDSEGGFRVENN